MGVSFKKLANFWRILVAFLTHGKYFRHPWIDNIAQLFYDAGHGYFGYRAAGQPVDLAGRPTKNKLDDA